MARCQGIPQLCGDEVDGQINTVVVVEPGPVLSAGITARGVFERRVEQSATGGKFPGDGRLGAHAFDAADQKLVVQQWFVGSLTDPGTAGQQCDDKDVKTDWHLTNAPAIGRIIAGTTGEPVGKPGYGKLERQPVGNLTGRQEMEN